MIKNKKQMIISISAFILVLMLTTVTFAFFNYTRTGTANVIRTGRISFNANQTETINLTNVFPIDKTTMGTDTVNTDETVITITGDTTYTDGIEYLVTAVDVNNTIGSGNNQKTVPISVSVTASNGLGTEDEEYFDNRENANSHLYRVLASDVLEENGRIAVGYIKAGSNGVNGTLTIKAYLDKDKIAITDTYDGNETDNMGTTIEWVDNRITLTSAEWNTLQTNGVSFKVKVESNEGIWVEEELSVNTMNTFPTVITDEKANIKEVYFNKMGVTRMQQAYDAATIKVDLTYNNEGKVLAWLEENIDDNTKYNLIIASDGETYLTLCNDLFAGWTNLEVIEFNNINTSRVTQMEGMFIGTHNLNSIDISQFDTRNVNSTQGMFNSSGIESINLGEIDMRNVVNMNGMFVGCQRLKTIDLSGVKTANVTQMYSFLSNCIELEYANLSGLGGDSLTGLSLFEHCTKLKEVDMSGFNFGVTSVFTGTQAFSGLASLEEIDLSEVSGTENFTLIAALFSNCQALKTIYISETFDLSNATNSTNMFDGCTSLVGGNSTTYDESNPKDKTYAIIDGTNGQPGYFTDIADKPTI